jgi:iron complex outermembrane receptor protein
MKIGIRKAILRGTASVLAIAAAVGAVQAQVVQSQQAETISVSGARASVMGALELRQNATQSINSIVAEDIGKLPDQTLVEALQHVTGIAINRSGYEPSAVLIRGLPDNQTLVNGRQIFTATGRTIALPAFSAEMLGRVDVHKTSSATDISGGVSGVINVFLRRPFDFDGFTLAAGAAANLPTLAAVLDPSGSALISDRWQTGIGEIGALLNVSWRNDHNREEAMTANARANLTNNGVVGSTVPSLYDDPANINPGCTSATFVGCPQRNLTQVSPIRKYPNGQYGAVLNVSDAYQRNGLVERASLNAVVQWRPMQGMEFFAEMFYTRLRNSVASDFFVAQTQNCNNAARTTTFPGTFFTESTTWGCFAITSNQPQKSKEDTAQFASGGHWDISENLRLTTEWSGTMSQTRSRTNVLDAMYNMPRDAVSVTVSPGGSGGMLWDYRTTNHQDLNGLFFNQYYDNWNDAKGGAWDGRFDLSWIPQFESPMLSWLESIDVGYRYNYRNANNSGPSGGGVGCSPTSRGTASSGANKYLIAAYDSPACVAFRDAASINGVSYNSVLAGGGTMTAATAARTAAHSAVGDPLANGTTNLLQIGGINLKSVSADATRRTHGAFFGGDYGLSWFATPNETWLRRDAEQVRNIMGYSGLPEKNAATSYIVAEGSHDLYWKNNYNFTAWGFPVDGNVGMRWVTTRLKQIGANAIYTPRYTNPPTNTIVDNSCLTCIQYVTNVAVKSTYDLMPSINARITLDEGLFLRLAASKTITRPTFTQTNPAERVTAATANVSGSITAGNPNLAPIKSYNVDVDVSYYWGQGNSLTFSVFHRDVAGYIQNQTAQVFVDGLPYNRNQPVNLVNRKVRGVEVGYSQFLDFLPSWGLPEFFGNFGWDVNATYIDGRFFNIRQWQANTSGIYEDGPLSIRVSWTWGSKYQEGTAVGTQPNNTWVMPRNNLDASINYDLTENLTIGLDASNISGSRYRSFGHAAGGDITVESNVFANHLRRFDRTVAMTLRYRY